MWSSGQRCACLLFCLLLSWTTAGAADTPVTKRSAIVLAAFGLMRLLVRKSEHLEKTVTVQ